MKLIIAEKPSVGRAIAEAVGASARKDGYIEGGGYVVSWCRGHLVDLCTPDAYDAWAGKWSAEKLPMIPAEWKWYTTSKDQFKVLEKLLGRSDIDQVVNACDADREGEGIFWRIMNKTGCTKPASRLWSTSLVPEQIRSDLAKAKSAKDYDGLAAAALGRAKADWLVGMNASRAYSVLYGHVSAGRVQTPTLSLIAERTRQISAFKSVPFYQTVLALEGGFEVFGEQVNSRQEAERYAEASAHARAQITDLVRKIEKNAAPKLYDLTSLQRDASTRAALSAEDSLSALQSLYEAKLTTYPRTESKYIGEADAAMAQKVISLIAHADILGSPLTAAFDSSRADVARVVDDAKVHGHGALLPTELCTPSALATLSGNELVIMRLICARLLAAVMEPATRKRVKLVCTCTGATYTASGSTITDASWIAIDDAAKALIADKSQAEASDTLIDPEQLIPDNLSQGDEVAVRSARVKEGKTTAPRPYTDASLLSAMEHAGRQIKDENLRSAIDDDSMHAGGLGTPATRAATIEKLIADGYVMRKGKSLIATERGCGLIDLVSASLKTPELTAQWELELARIEAGETKLAAFMDGIEKYASQVVAEAKRDFDPARGLALSDVKSLGTCPLCGKPVTRRGATFQCLSNRHASKEDGYKLLKGCGFKLFAKQCKKELSESQVSHLLKGDTVHLTGLLKKDGSAFEADARLEEPFDSGWVKFINNKGGKTHATKRSGARQ